MHALHIDPFGPALSDRRNIPTELIDLVLDIGKYVCRAQFGENLGDESAWDREAFVIRHNVQRDVQFVKLTLEL